jgi:8-oxo-dGTP diphosphatase
LTIATRHYTFVKPDLREGAKNNLVDEPVFGSLPEVLSISPMPSHTPHPISAPRHYPICPLVGVGVAVFNAAGQVLLVQRGRPPRQGQWGLPGGLVDLGERLVDAARREVREECGVEIALGGFITTFEPIEWDAAGKVEYHYVVLDYWAEYVNGEVAAQDDAAAVAWCNVDELRGLGLNHETYEVILQAAELRERAT